MHDETLQRVEVTAPRLAIEHALHVGLSGLPAPADAGRAEIDVLGVILPRKRRREQPHDVDAGQAAIGDRPAALGSDVDKWTGNESSPAGLYNLPGPSTAARL